MRVKSGKIENSSSLFATGKRDWDLEIFFSFRFSFDGLIHEENIDDEILRYN